VLEIEIGGPDNDQSDHVVVNGLARLGETLKVSLADFGEGIYSPQLGEVFGFLVSAGTDGMFDHYDFPDLAPGLKWSIAPGDATTFRAVVAATTILAGDYNNDGTVDAADYVVWRKNEGTDNVLPNNPLGGTIGATRYDQWRTHFGQTTGGASVTAGLPVVPEPATTVLRLIGATALMSVRKRSCCL
jgi:hypothetical protein